MAKIVPDELLNEQMQTMHVLLTRLIDGGLTPAEAQEVLCAMVARVLATHPASMAQLGCAK